MEPPRENSIEAHGLVREFKKGPRAVDGIDLRVDPGEIWPRVVDALSLVGADHLADRDAGELSAAIAIWERAGALPYIGRGRAERGLITGDLSETEAGLAIVKKLGDTNYADRFAARV